MALLVLGAVAVIVGRGLLPSGHAWRPVLRSTHLVLGQLIFAACLVRLVVRWCHPLPPLPGSNRWASWAARGLHGLFYVVLLAQPVTGVLFMQAGDKAVSLAGFTWPAMVPSNPELHFQLKDAHVLAGQVLYVLIALHVGAALFHHHVLRDDTLRRMLPWGRPTRLAPPAAWPDNTSLPQAATPAALAVQAIDDARLPARPAHAVAAPVGPHRQRGTARTTE